MPATTASGSTAQNTIVMIDHDKGLPVENPQLEILVGPSINRTLLDAVIGSGASAELGTWMPSSGIERQIADVLGVSVVWLVDSAMRRVPRSGERSESNSEPRQE